MLRRHAIIPILILAFLSLSACKEAAPIDAVDRQSETDDPHSGRLVSLAPNVTEIIFFLDMEESLVGRTEYCVRPTEAKSIPTIGGIADPDLEAIIRLKPTLVLATELTPRRVLQKLNELGFQSKVLPTGGIESVFQTVQAIAELGEKEDVAADWTEQSHQRLDGLEDLQTDQPSGLLLLGKEGFYAAGANSFAGEALELAGLINTAAETKLEWPRLSIETVIDYNPSIIFIASDNDFPGDELIRKSDWGQSDPRLASIHAIENERVFEVGDSTLTTPAPRIVDAILKMRAISAAASNPNDSPQ